jgi:soluble lytic murein transglycosylase-like protein
MTKTSLTMSKTSLVLMSALMVPVCVAPANAQTAPVVSTQTSAQKTLSYDQLRRSYKVDSRITWDKVQADSASHAGRVIEVSGIVTGLFSVQNARTLIVRVANSPVSVAVPTDMHSSPSLRSGNGVRALARVNKPEPNAPATSPILTLVAVTDAPVVAESSTQLPTAPINESSLSPVMTLPMPPNAKPVNEVAKVIPPMTTMRPLPSRSGSPIQRTQPAQPVAPQSVGPADENGWMNFFKNIARQHNSKLSSTQTEQIAQAIIGAGREQAIDPRFIASIIAVESDFNPYCLSRSGAMGLGQIMPFNLKEARITNAWDPVQNIYGMARLLKGHLNMFGSRPNGTLLAVAAYNAGPNAVKRAGYKVPNGAQVQRYVWKVYYKYKTLAPELF